MHIVEEKINHVFNDFTKNKRKRTVWPLFLHLENWENLTYSKTPITGNKQKKHKKERSYEITNSYPCRDWAEVEQTEE